MSDSSTSSKSITAFNNIFAARLDKIIKDIKKIRRDPTKKDKLKLLLQEAKHLKKTIKDSSRKQIHNISIPYEFNVSGEFIIHSESCIVSDGMKLINITTSINELSQQILTFNFSIKQ